MLQLGAIWGNLTLMKKLILPKATHTVYTILRQIATLIPREFGKRDSDARERVLPILVSKRLRTRRSRNGRDARCDITPLTSMRKF